MTETELLLTSILNCSRAGLYSGNVSLNVSQAEKLSRSVCLRSQGIPLQYILGETEFFGLNFKVNNSVLIPRPETEILVEEAIKAASGFRLQPSGINILDLGTGSGCIAVSLAKFLREGQITAIDVSADAITLAKENARLNKVEAQINFIQSNLFSAICGLRTPFDLIVSNPPYIPGDDISGLQREVRYEPRSALEGGKDGLDFYRLIINDSPKFLKDDGLLMMEMGYGQSGRIKNIFEKTDNFEIIGIVKDYSDIERVVIARQKNG